MIRLVCPADPKHGQLQAVPLGWYCPNVAHDGWRDQPRTRAFFTTAEVEAGPMNRTPETKPSSTTDRAVVGAVGSRQAASSRAPGSEPQPA